MKCLVLLLPLLALVRALPGGRVPKFVADSKIVNPDPAAPDPNTYNAEAGDHFQGDMDVDPKLVANNRNAVVDTAKQWTTGPICYFVDFNKTAYATHAKAITDAIADYHSMTCLKFVEKTKATADANCIRIFIGVGCYSSIGKVGGIQDLSLGEGCQYKGTAIHEIMHAMGFSHEQSREDRDEYVKIFFENIETDKTHNFDKEVVGFNNYGRPYDYNSVMHYGRNYFTKNGLDTMVPTKDPNAQIGQRAGFSTEDLMKITKVYCMTISTVGRLEASYTLPSTLRANLTALINTARAGVAASGMMEMTYSDGLAMQAEAKAKECIDREYLIETQPGVTPAINYTYTFDLSDAYSTANDQANLHNIFADNLATYQAVYAAMKTNGSSKCILPNGAWRSPCWDKYGPAINADTNLVGCAIAKCGGLKNSTKSNNVVYYQAVCAWSSNYGTWPGFSMANNPNVRNLYSTGTACSDCKYGGTCLANGLCKSNGKICRDRPPLNRLATACQDFINANPSFTKDYLCTYMENTYGWDCKKTCGRCT